MEVTATHLLPRVLLDQRGDLRAVVDRRAEALVGRGRRQAVGRLRLHHLVLHARRRLRRVDLVHALGLRRRRHDLRAADLRDVGDAGVHDLVGAGVVELLVRRVEADDRVGAVVLEGRGDLGVVERRAGEQRRDVGAGREPAADDGGLLLGAAAGGVDGGAAAGEQHAGDGGGERDGAGHVVRMTRLLEGGFAAASARAVPEPPAATDGRLQRATCNAARYSCRAAVAPPVTPGGLRAVQDGLAGAAGEDVGERRREQRLQRVARGIVDGRRRSARRPRRSRRRRGAAIVQALPTAHTGPPGRPPSARRFTSVGTPSLAAVQLPPPSECRTTPSPTTQTSVAPVPKMARSSFGVPLVSALQLPLPVDFRIVPAGADRPQVPGDAPQAAQLGGADNGLRDPAAAGARVHDGVASAGDVDVLRRDGERGEEARAGGGGVRLRAPGGAAAVQDGGAVTDEEDVARRVPVTALQIEGGAAGELRRPGRAVVGRVEDVGAVGGGADGVDVGGRAGPEAADGAGRRRQRAAADASRARRRRRRRIGRRDEAVAVAAAGQQGDRGLRQVVRGDGDRRRRCRVRRRRRRRRR